MFVVLVAELGGMFANKFDYGIGLVILFSYIGLKFLVIFGLSYYCAMPYVDLRIPKRKIFADMLCVIVRKVDLRDMPYIRGFDFRFNVNDKKVRLTRFIRPTDKSGTYYFFPIEVVK